MFPLRDDQPIFSTPFVTYFLIALNLIITAPIYALVRRLLRPAQRDELTAEVQLLG